MSLFLGLCYFDLKVPMLPKELIVLQHGKAGSMELIESQKKYLSAYSDAVRELFSSGKPKLTDEAKKQLTGKMEQFLPNAGLTFLIAHSADAVATELSSTK
jgi:hypothetical protein